MPTPLPPVLAARRRRTRRDVTITAALACGWAVLLATVAVFAGPRFAFAFGVLVVFVILLVIAIDAIRRPGR